MEWSNCTALLPEDDGKSNSTSEETTEDEEGSGGIICFQKIGFLIKSRV